MAMAPAPALASDRKRLDGVCLDGVWLCAVITVAETSARDTDSPPGNCTPRKKAVLREVRRNTPNKGKFFWTCPAYPYCDIFLWRDDARLRETGLPPASQPDGEPPPPPKTPVLTQRLITACGVSVTPGRRPDAGGGSGPAETASVATPCPTPDKRKRDVFEEEEGEDDDDDDDADEFSDLGSDDERQLADLADRSADAARRHAAPLAPFVARTLFRGPDAKRPRPSPSGSPRRSTPRRHRPTPPTTASSTTSWPSSSPSPSRPTPSPPSAPPAASSWAAPPPATPCASVTEDVAALRRRVADLERTDALLNSQLTNIKAKLMKVYEDN